MLKTQKKTPDADGIAITAMKHIISRGKWILLGHGAEGVISLEQKQWDQRAIAREEPYTILPWKTLLSEMMEQSRR